MPVMLQEPVLHPRDWRQCLLPENTWARRLPGLWNGAGRDDNISSLKLNQTGKQHSDLILSAIVWRHNDQHCGRSIRQRHPD